MTTCKGQEHVACTLTIYLFECADYKNTNVYKFVNLHFIVRPKVCKYEDSTLPP